MLSEPKVWEREKDRMTGGHTNTKGSRAFRKFRDFCPTLGEGGGTENVLLRAFPLPCSDPFQEAQRVVLLLVCDPSPKPMSR